ncbi:MAG: zf-HC2 domain-containing protein [Acidobacteriota bacterium]
MNEERADRKAVHVGSKRLVAYHRGTLPEEEREAVQEHLSLCSRCTGLLRELREFEAAAAEVSTGPDPLREEAWASLVRRLPPKAPAARPADAGRPARTGAPRLRFVHAAYTAAAALLLAACGLLTWQSVAVSRLERRLDEREQALATARLSQEETQRRLDAAQARIRGLETERAAGRETGLADRVAELTSEVEALRRAARSLVAVSLSPRFVLRGQESPEGDFLRAGGTANRLQAEAGRVSAALDLTGFSASPQVRVELADRAGTVLWSGRLPGGESLAGDDGTLVAIQGLTPGSYRLRIEGAGHRAEYRLDVGE